jgi:hypothetical protein
MGATHALIEDTLLMLLLGASLWGILGLRLVLVMAAGIIVNHVYDRFVPG